MPNPCVFYIVYYIIFILYHKFNVCFIPQVHICLPVYFLFTGNTFASHCVSKWSVVFPFEYSVFHGRIFFLHSLVPHWRAMICTAVKVISLRLETRALCVCVCCAVLSSLSRPTAPGGGMANTPIDELFNFILPPAELENTPSRADGVEPRVAPSCLYF